MATRVLELVILVVALAWFAWDPGFEQGLAVLGAITAVVAAEAARSRLQRRYRQSQRVDGGSTGIQVGRDLSVRHGERDVR